MDLAEEKNNDDEASSLYSSADATTRRRWALYTASRPRRCDNFKLPRAAFPPIIGPGVEDFTSDKEVSHQTQHMNQHKLNEHKLKQTR
jgi:hypothetical protein